MSAAKAIANAIIESVSQQPLRCWDGEVDLQFVLEELASRTERRGYINAGARLKSGSLEVVGESPSGGVGFNVTYQLRTRKELRGRIGWLVNSVDDLDVLHSFA